MLGRIFFPFPPLAFQNSSPFTSESMFFPPRLQEVACLLEGGDRYSPEDTAAPPRGLFKVPGA